MADLRGRGARSLLGEDLHASRVLFGAAWRSALQYRLSFISVIFGGVIFQGAQLLFIGILLARFSTISGWHLNDIALLFSLRLAAHAFYVVPAGAILQIDAVVQQGDVDRYMLRPAGLYVQILARRAPLMALGDALLGFASLAIFAIRAPVAWTAGHITFLIAALVGGGLVETGIQTFLAGLSFRLTSTSSLRLLADDTLTRFGGYPLTIFNRWGLWSLTFIFPMAFIAYLPTTVLLNRTSEVPLPAWIAYASPALGIFVFSLGYAFFVHMIRHYNSPGS